MDTMPRRRQIFSQKRRQPSGTSEHVVLSKKDVTAGCSTWTKNPGEVPLSEPSTSSITTVRTKLSPEL